MFGTSIGSGVGVLSSASYVEMATGQRLVMGYITFPLLGTGARPSPAQLSRGCSVGG